MYWQLAQMALAVAQGGASRTAEGAQMKLAEGTAQARNIQRGSANIERAAKGSLTRFMQGENNRRMMKAAGNVFNAAQETMARTNDANVSNRIERQIADAEAAGALAANAAFSGAAGGSNEMLAMTQQLQQARRAAAIKTQNKQVTYEQMKQISGIMPQAVEQLDITQFNDGIDYSIDTANRLTSGSSAIGDIIGSQGFKSFMQNSAGSFFGDLQASTKYGTNMGSEQTRMLREQDSWFTNNYSFKI